MLEKNRGQDCKNTTTLWLFIIWCVGKNGGQNCKKTTLRLFTIGRVWEKWRKRLQDEDDLSDLHYRMCLIEMEDKIARKRGPYASSLYSVFEKNWGQDCKKKKRPYRSSLYDMLQKWRTRLQEDSLTCGWIASRDGLQEACQSSTCRRRTGVENHCNLHGWYKHIHILSTQCHLHTEDPL